MCYLSEKFPEKPIETVTLSKEIEYTVRLLECTKKEIAECANQKIKDIYGIRADRGIR